MPDASPDATPHRFDAMGTRSERDTVERFARALDGLVASGAEPGSGGDLSLAHLIATASSIQRHDGVWMSHTGPQSAMPIGEQTKRRIWEDLMAQHASTLTSPATVTRRSAIDPVVGRIGAVMNPWVESADQRPARRRANSGVLRFVPDLQPLTTLALVIATVIAITAAFSGIAERGGPAVTPPASAEGLAGLSAQHEPTTPADVLEAVPTADPADEFQRPIPLDDADCPTELRSSEEIAAILRDPGPVTPRAYLPATTPEPAVAEEVARAGRTYIACAYAMYAMPVNTDRALQTPRFIYEQPTNAFFRAAGGAADLATPDERAELVRLMLGEDFRANRLLVTDLAVSREEYEAAGLGWPPNVSPASAGTPAVDLPNQYDVTFRPQTAIQLADGRIAVSATYLVDPTDIEAWFPDDSTDPVFVDMSIFARDATRGNHWALDERLNVCLDSDLCDELNADIDPAGEALFPSATPAAPASPASSPEADTSDGVTLTSTAGCAVAPRSAEEVAAFRTDSDLERNPARDYTVTGSVDPATVSGAIIAANVESQCEGTGGARDTSGLESPATSLSGATSRSAARSTRTAISVRSTRWTRSRGRRSTRTGRPTSRNGPRTRRPAMGTALGDELPLPPDLGDVERDVGRRHPDRRGAARGDGLHAAGAVRAGVVVRVDDRHAARHERDHQRLLRAGRTLAPAPHGPGRGGTASRPGLRHPMLL